MKRFLKNVLPLRMWMLVVTLCVSGVVVFIEALAYEETVWTGPAKVVSASPGSDNTIRLTLKSLDGKYDKITTTNQSVVLQFINYHEDTFNCSVSESGSSGCSSNTKK